MKAGAAFGRLLRSRKPLAGLHVLREQLRGSGAFGAIRAGRRRHRLSSRCLVLLLAAGEAQAWGLVGEGSTRRVEQESMLIVWDHERQQEHLVVAARAAGLKAVGAYALSVPREAQLDQPVEGVSEAMGRLVPGSAPLAAAAGDGPSLAPRPGGLAALCQTLKLTCNAEALSWSDEAQQRREVALVPLAAPADGVSGSAYAHLRFDTPQPFVPFAEPVDASLPEPEPPPPGPDHPPRVRIWIELFNESRSGSWERQMDAAGEGQSEALAGCYGKALEQRKRLAGDVHVQLRMGGDQITTDEEERASSKPLEPVARCFASALARASWPKNPFGKAIRFEVHASLKPPAPVARRLLAVVLSTQDGEPRLGSADDPRVVPELRPLASFEPEPAALIAAFPEPTRKALGIDPARRWRVIAFESGADPHPLRDDILLRPLAAPAPRPGEAPLPVVARGDRPSTAASAPAAPARWWRGRKARLAAALSAALALVALVAWRERR